MVELPSDRFTSVVITPGPDDDLVTFRFSNPSIPSDGEPPEGTLETAEPPLTEAGSGQPIDLTGAHAVQLRFRNISIQNDVGQPVYDGPTEYKPDLPALRHMVLFDMSEGVVGWYLGFDGTGCVSMLAVGDNVTVRIAHS